MRDLLAESLAGVLQRPGRTVLTMLGTVLGVGAFVAVLGLTSTASGQISEHFNALVATEVVVKGADNPDTVTGDLAFPEDADGRAEQLRGVRRAGLVWPLPEKLTKSLRGSLLPGTRSVENLPVLAASAGFLPANRPTAWTGRLFDRGHEDRRDRVAVLGVGAARQLGIYSIAGMPAIFVDGVPFAVIGVLQDVDRNTELLSAVVLPSRTVELLWGKPEATNSVIMRIDTDMGAAATVAGQIAVALRPDDPMLFAVVPPPDPRQLRDSVDSDLDAFFLVLAGICLLIGTISITNTTSVAVLERLSEIGLRRSLGARPAHIGGQFLTEAAIVGTIGGLIGTALAVLAVVSAAAAQRWTPLLDPWLVLPAPLLGTVIGVLAGIYPAMRAASVQPVSALQR
ncbi:ABC transporter permease [Plantactinospora sp. KLBMP9567]|uniref:ABC transporter permease n=1 Tax=Plantactinospora sp. KLBMP9567 TaxID=3085900 RepID=UPI002981D343|nr:ABC transporter permease [Plantactinospora sp. KLBMP9567]MDW5327204.1 ABC transporter permease [Plantactinospora sp. KLBMP9567]